MRISDWSSYVCSSDRSSAKRVGKIMRSSLTRFAAMAIATAGLILSPLPAAAQVTEVDPNTAIDSDLDNPNQTPPPPATNETPDYGTDYGAPTPDPSLDCDLAPGNEQVTGVPQDSAAGTTPTDPGTAAPRVDPSTNHQEDDLIGAAEGTRSEEQT